MHPTEVAVEVMEAVEVTGAAEVTEAVEVTEAGDTAEWEEDTAAAAAHAAGDTHNGVGSGMKMMEGGASGRRPAEDRPPTRLPRAL